MRFLKSGVTLALFLSFRLFSNRFGCFPIGYIPLRIDFENIEFNKMLETISPLGICGENE